MSPGLAGDVFSLSGDAQYEGQWNGLELLRANAGIDVRVTAELEANLCHGLEVAVKARASAEAAAALSIFVAAAGEVSAFAQAGANVKVTLAPDLFDRFGLVADVGAFAEAAVAGRLSIGLDIGQIKGLAAALMGGDVPMVPNQLALDIFGAFMDEVQIGAGVWGRAAFSAMARAHLEVYGSLADPERAGFVFEAGGALGLEAGTGWDFFAFARLVDVHRFYARASDLITAEVVRVGREKLGEEYRPALQMVDLCLPAVLQVVLVAGQTAATSMIADSNRIVEPTVRAVLEQMRRFILRKFVEAGERALAELVEGVAGFVAGVGLDEDERATLRAKVESLVGRLRDRDGWDIDLLTGVAADITDIVAVVAPEEVTVWRRPVTIAWCGLSALKALDEAGGGLSAGGGASVLGFGVGVELSEQDFDLPDVPEVVLDEFEEYFGARPSSLRFSDAVDYIGKTSVGPHLDAHLPELAQLLEMVEQHLDVTPGDVVSAFLLGMSGGNLTTSELYQKLRKLLREAIDDHIDASLLPALRDTLGEGDDARLYVEEVVQPSLLGCTNFVFERLDQVVAGNYAAAFGDSFQVGVSTLVYKVFARNVIVLGHILLDHVMNELEVRLGELRQEVAADPDHILVTGGTVLAQGLAPGLVAPETLSSATQRLVEQLIGAGQIAFGSGIWTPERRTAMRRLLLEALVGDDLDVDYHSATGLENVFAEIAECNHVPNAVAVGELGGLLADVTLDQIGMAVGLVVPALAEFYLAITAEAVETMDRLAREAIDEVAELMEDALRWASFWAGEAERFHGEAEAQALILAGRLADIEAAFALPEARTEILDRLHADGVAVVTSTVAANTPGWNLMDANARAVALAGPLVIYEGLFLVARPLLDAGLGVLGNLSGILADAIVAATTVDDVAAEMGSALAQAVRDGVNEQIDDFGLELPEEISVDDAAQAAKDLLVTDEVATWMRTAFAALAEQNDLNLAAADAERDEATARANHTEHAGRHTDLLGGRLAVRIDSPTTLDGDTQGAFVYGPRVPVRIQVDGARPSFVEAGATRRLFLSINGRRIPYHAGDWEEHGDGLRFHQEIDFGHGLMSAGLNVLECSVSNGVDTVLRHEVRFVVDPDAPVVNVLAVEPAASQFDVPDVDDHLATEEEYVTLVNTGLAPVVIDGWVLYDRARHSYEFPERTLAPGGALRVVTGAGVDTDDRLHWGRGRAIWNNRGDVVLVVDKDRVLRTEFVFHP